MRTLVISNIPPIPLTNGGNQRTYHLLEALRTMGEVDLLLVPRYAPPDERQLVELRQRYGVVEVAPTSRRGDVLPWKLLRPFSPGRVDRVANALGDRRFYYRPDPAAAAALRAMLSRQRYDMFVARYAQSAGVSGIVDVARPVIIDIDDLDTHVVETNLADANDQPLKQWIFRRQLRQLNLALPHILNQAAHCWVTTPKDGASVASGQVSILPNIPIVEANAAFESVDVSKRIILVGAMYFRPNVEGAAFFVEKIWPQVRKAHPTAEFRIVGAGLDAGLASQWRKLPGVTIVGYVDSLAPEYAGSAFTIVPVMVGGGTKIKVLEAMAYGRTCVITSHAHRGYEQNLRHGESLLVADEADAFAEHCIRLLTNVHERNSLAERGRKVVGTSYSTARFVEIVQRDVAAVIGQRKPHNAETNSAL